MQITALPPITIVRGQPFQQVWRFLSDYPTPRHPLDLSAWTGFLTIGPNFTAAPYITAPLVLDGDGWITADLTGTQTEAIAEAHEKAGLAPAVFQIELTIPSPELPQVWQGNAVIKGAFA